MKRVLKLRNILLTLGLVVGTAGLVQADDTNSNHDFTFSITDENDLFVYPKTDKHYTQGLQISLLWPDEVAPWPLRPLAWLPDFGLAGATHKYGLRVGQDMYTPIDLRLKNPSITDRPYAGWLFVGFVRDDRGTAANGIPTRDHLEVELGVVGPGSLVSDTQIWYHKLIGSLRPDGWRYQLNNEPGLLINFDRQLKIWDSGKAAFLQAQLLPHAGLNLGNIQTSLRFGPQFRLGHNIPDEFAKVPALVHGFYLFSAVDGRIVGYNEFLDGDAFQKSRGVAREPAVLEVQGGLVVVLRRTEISYTYHYINKEFKTQNKYDAYASINLTQTF